MTAIIEIVNPAQLDHRYEYWGVSTPSNFEALDMLARCFPHFDTVGYRFRNMVYFVMNYGRAYEPRQENG